jgi:hypothetical protein
VGRYPRTSSSTIFAALFCGSVASAQLDGGDHSASAPAPASGPEADHGPSNAGSAPDEKPAPKLAWAGTVLAWDQSATAQTMGIGQDYLSANPTYDMTFSLEPVVTLYDDDVNRVVLKGYVGLFHEFTNSDTTTKQGETSVTGGTGAADARLYSEYARTLYQSGRVKTVFGVRLPVLDFPTSKTSLSAGKILGLGARLKLVQQFPIAPSGAGFLETGTVAAVGGYGHVFTRAIVPVNPELQRVRLDTNGQAVAGDQLQGAPFAEHQVPIAIVTELALTERLSLSTGFAWVLSWKYPLATGVNVCGVVDTGCTPVQEPADPQRFGVITEFSVELGVSLFDELDVRAGYQNATLQIGPDGQRRSMFYSPDARFSLGLVTHLDALYLRASGANPVAAHEEIARRSTSFSVE